MAFLDTIEMVWKYREEIPLEDVLEMGKERGFFMWDFRQPTAGRDKVCVLPRKGKSLRSGSPEHQFRPDAPDCPMDSPLKGSFAKRRFGGITFCESYAHTKTTLGYFMRGHNALMDNAKYSTDALQEYSNAIQDYFPFLESQPKISRIDITYQFQLPFYKNIFPQLFGLMQEDYGPRATVYMLANGIVGRQNRNRSWSIYGKYQQMLETGQSPVTELKDVVRITEEVRKTSFNKRIWSNLWDNEGNMEINQKGIIQLLKDRWEKYIIMPSGKLNIQDLLSKFPKRQNDVITYCYIMQNPEHFSLYTEHLEQTKGRKNAHKYFNIHFSDIEKECKNLSRAFSITIPDEKVFLSSNWTPCYYLN